MLLVEKNFPIDKITFVFSVVWSNMLRWMLSHKKKKLLKVCNMQLSKIVEYLKSDINIGTNYHDQNYGKEEKYTSTVEQENSRVTSNS